MTKHTITISKDGWVSLETGHPDAENYNGSALGNIGVDVEIFKPPCTTPLP